MHAADARHDPPKSSSLPFTGTEFAADRERLTVPNAPTLEACPFVST